MKVFPLADFAVWGEGEHPLYHLIKALEDGADLKDVPQLIYREEDKVCSTRNSSECVDLDSYPFADHTDYFDAMQKFVSRSRQVSIPIWGSRSCPWNKCKFCVLNENYSYRTRSPENIVEEIKFQSKRHNNYSFTFVDTEIAGNKKRFKILLKLLAEISAERKEPYSFFGDLSPIFIDSETASYMKRASFVSLQIGFEALTDSLLKKMEKRHGFAYNIQALKFGSRYGLRMDGLNVLKGIPPETREDIMESCNNVRFLRFFFKTYKLDPIPFALFKGSPFYEEMTQP